MIYEFKITINKLKCSGTNTNFTYLFSSLTSSIPAGFWSHVTDPNGLDIKFYDTDTITELDREIVTYSAGTHKVEIWVRIPTVTDAVSKEIYCRYGGTTRISDVNTWRTSNARYVFHFKNNDHSESCGYSDGEAHDAGQAWVDSVIEKGLSFNGTTDYFIENFNDGLAGNLHNGIYTVSGWAKVHDTLGNFAVIQADTGSWMHDTMTFMLGLYSGSIGTGWHIQGWTGSSWIGVASGQTIVSQLDAWHHVVGVNTGSEFRIYVDGVLKNTNVVAYSRVADLDDYHIGWYNGMYPNRSEQLIDEVRTYNVVKSTDWVLTEYNSQNDPATFSSCGPESGSGTAVRVPLIYKIV